MGHVGWNAPDFSTPPTFRKYSDTAPEYRRIAPGTNIEGECTGASPDKGKECPAFGKLVWCKVGENQNGEDILMMPGRCPLCKGGVKKGGQTLGFSKCSYEIEARP